MTAPGLRIARVEAIPVALPLKRPLMSAAGTRRAAHCLLVRIEAADGTTGWGEAGESMTMTGETVAGMKDMVEAVLAPILVGHDAGMRAPLMRRIAADVYGNAAARAAVEMALLDLAGRHYGVPACEMLGGAWRDGVSPLWFVGTGALESDIAEAKAKQALGYRAFKMKAGVEPLETDIRRLRALREALGPDAALSVDANMAWDLPAAKRFVRAVADLDVLFVEQPLDRDDLPGMAEVARASTVAIGADEGIHGLGSVLAHHRAGAAAGVSLKPCKAGGVGEGVRLSATCAAMGISVHIASLIESSIATAAVLQAGLAAPHLDWGISLTNHYLAEDLVEAPLTLVDGVMRRPAAPGLGVTVVPAQVERFRIR